MKKIESSNNEVIQWLVFALIVAVGIINVMSFNKDLINSVLVKISIINLVGVSVLIIIYAVKIKDEIKQRGGLYGKRSNKL